MKCQHQVELGAYFKLHGLSKFKQLLKHEPTPPEFVECHTPQVLLLEGNLEWFTSNYPTVERFDSEGSGVVAAHVHKPEPFALVGRVM